MHLNLSDKITIRSWYILTKCAEPKMKSLKRVKINLVWVVPFRMIKRVTKRKILKQKVNQKDDDIVYEKT